MHRVNEAAILEVPLLEHDGVSVFFEKAADLSGDGFVSARATEEQRSLRSRVRGHRATDSSARGVPPSPPGLYEPGG